MDNVDVAHVLEKVADLLDILDENPFRVRAHRSAARTIERNSGSIAEVARERPKGLTELPAVGRDLAGKIVELVRTGDLHVLADLRRRVPAGLTEVMRVGGVGPKRAKLFFDKLGVDGVAALERAAQEGRLRGLHGIGDTLERRIRDGCHAFLRTARVDEHARLRGHVARACGTHVARLLPRPPRRAIMSVSELMSTHAGCPQKSSALSVARITQMLAAICGSRTRLVVAE